MISRANRLRGPNAAAAQLCMFICLLFTAGGCGTVREGSCRSLLTDEEMRYAEALARYSQGLIYQEESGENSPEALDAYVKAVELDPDNYALHSAVGLLARYQDKPDTAAALLHYRKAIQLAPTKGLLYIALADLHFHLQEDAKAMAVLRAGFRKSDSPTLVLAYANRYVKAFIEAHAVNRAIMCLEFLAEHSDQPRRYHQLLGHLYAGQGLTVQAIHHYTMAANADKPAAESFIALAALYAAGEQPAEALATLIRGSEALPDNADMLFTLARFYSAEEKYDEAITIFARIRNLIKEIRKQTMTAEVYILYGATCEQAGRIEDAEKVFEECIAIHPDAHRALNYLAYMWAERGVNLDMAHAYVTRALELEPEDGAYLDTLGWIYYKQERYQLAMKMIGKAADIIGDDPVVCEHLGDIHRAMGEHADAIQQWSRSFRLDPSSKTVAAKLSKHGVDLDKLRLEGDKPSPLTHPPSSTTDHQ